MVIELRSCPFCGSRTAPTVDALTAHIFEGEEVESFCVYCDPRQGGCGASSFEATSAEGAATKWNRRSPEVRQ